MQNESAATNGCGHGRFPLFVFRMYGMFVKALVFRLASRGIPSYTITLNWTHGILADGGDMITLDEVRAAAKPLLDKYGLAGATVFGSYARGEQTDASDIDMVVDVAQDARPRTVLSFAWELGKALGIDVDAYGSNELVPGGAVWRAASEQGVRL